jgi:hypothetical protein
VIGASLVVLMLTRVLIRFISILIIYSTSSPILRIKRRNLIASYFVRSSNLCGMYRAGQCMWASRIAEVSFWRGTEMLHAEV